MASLYRKLFFTVIISLLAFPVFSQTPSYNLFSGYGNALKYDGINDYCQVINSSGDFNFSGSSERTVSAWVYLNDVKAQIFSKKFSGANTHQLSFTVGNQHVIVGYDDFNGAAWQGFYSTTNLRIGKFYHLAFTQVGDSVKIYINGKKDSSFKLDAAHMSSTTSTGPVTFGGKGLFVDYANEMVDEITVWNRGLSDLEIKALYDGNIDDTDVSILAHYNLDKIGAGDTIFDLATRNNNAINYNASIIPSTVPIIKYYGKGIFTDDLFAYDIDQNSLSYHIKTQPQTGSLNVAISLGHYSFNKTQHGNDSFTYYAVNSLGDTSNTYKVEVRDTTSLPIAGYGNAMLCDSSGCLNIMGFNYLTDTISFEFWMKPNDVTNNPVFSISAGGSNGRDDNVSIKIVNGKLLTVILDDNGGSQTLNGKLNIIPNKWYHVYCSYELDNKARLYVNGILDSESNADYPIKEDGSAEPMVTIGATTDDNIYEYFNGEIDEFASWDTVFTSWDIQNYHMNNIYDGSEQNFIYGFHFDKANADTIEAFGAPVYGILTASFAVSTAPLKLTTKKDYQANGKLFGYGQGPIIYHILSNPNGNLTNFSSTSGSFDYERDFYGSDELTWYVIDGNDTSNVYSMNISPKIITGDVIPTSITAYADTIEVMSNLFVLDGTTLTILDDTYVKSHEDCGIYVLGRVLAQGSNTKGIVFTAADTSGFSTYPDSTIGGWHGIRFSNTPLTNDTSFFDYCTISNGKAIAAPSTNQANGGGLYVYGFDKIKISNSIVKNNYATNCGGGICAIYSKITINKCDINYNRAFGEHTETWKQSGGGVYVKYSKAHINNTKISYNYSKYGGGAINAYGHGTNLYLVNSLIFKNISTSNAGGIMSLYGDTIHIINSTIVQNLNAGLRGDHNYEYKIINSIVSNNTGSEVWFWESDTVQRIIKHSLIENGDVYVHQTNNGLTNIGNIITNPEFLNMNNENYRLQQNSPCINSGDPTWTTDSVGFNYDLDGNDRILSSIIDMGCYEFNSPVIDTIYTTNTTCGDTNGVAQVVVSGGNPPYSYIWSNGDTIATANNLIAGNYSIQITDSYGSIIEGYCSINDIGGPLLVIDTVFNVSCNGYNDGAINITATGGAGMLSYNWSDGSTVDDINGLLAGTYMVEVSDTNNCKVMETFVVSEPAELSINYSTLSSHCGLSDGAIYLNVSGGTNPYNYLWNTNDTTSTIDTLISGIYNVSVVDYNGCSSEITIAVSDSTGPIITVDSVYDSFCGANQGAIYTSITGGAMPYDTIYWSNGITDSTFVDSVDVGTYSFVVVDNAGCTGNLMIDVPVIQPLEQPICMVTVDTTTGKNLVVWEKEQSTGISHYNIYRKVVSTFMLVDTVPYDSLSVYVDSVADPTLYAWSYKISAVDFCGNESPLSEIHKTIHMAMNVGLGGEINLSWSNYQGFYYDRFYIYRYTTSGIELLYTLGSDLNSCTDPNPPTGIIKYFVAVEDTSGCDCLGSKLTGGPYSHSLSNLDDYEISTSINKIVTDGIKVYPNPTTGKVFIEGENINFIEVLNVNGQTIYTQQVNANTANIDLSDRTKGIYFIKIRNNKTVLTYKIILE